MDASLFAYKGKAFGSNAAAWWGFQGAG